MMYRSMVYLGALSELARRLPSTIREATEQNDWYTVTNLRSIPSVFVALGDDASDEAASHLSEAEAHLTRGAVLLQHYFCLAARGHLDLYRGDAQAGYARFQALMPALRRSLILRVQPIRVATLDLRARLAIAASAGSHSRLQEAAMSAHSLQSMRPAWARALGDLVAGLLAAKAASDEKAGALFARAAAAFDAGSMPLHSAVAKTRLGQTLGGQTGRELQANAVAWLRSNGYRNVDATVESLAPLPP